MKGSAPFDFILWGATGFTGKLVAEYLVRLYGGKPKGFSWALAGRNYDKLVELRRELSTLDQDADQLPIIIASLDQSASLDSLVAQTKLVVSVAGPYGKLGTPIIKACCEKGVDYCDINGELSWAYQMIHQYSSLAKKQGCKIIFHCGFDSIPADLGTYIMQRESWRRWQKSLDQVEMVILRVSGGFSQGTVASGLSEKKKFQQDPVLRKECMGHYALVPKEGRLSYKPQNKGWKNKIHWNSLVRGWVAPVFSGFVDTRVVHRSNYLNQFLYGREFSFCESIFLSHHYLGARSEDFKMKSKALYTYLKFQKGPSFQERHNGFFQCVFFGKEKRGDSLQNKLRGISFGSFDPGYGQTAVMLSETALALTLHREKLKDKVGFLTPASCLGDLLVERLKNKGMSFHSEPWSYN